MRQRLRQVAAALSVAVLLGTQASQAHATVYIVNFDGAVVDLSGSITVNSLGSFSPGSFNSVVVSYSITASVNGNLPFTWTQDNSNWIDSTLGSAVSIDVTSNVIELRAPTGGTFEGTNVFLIANDRTNGAIENLRIFQDALGYRAPFPAEVYFENGVPIPFILAQVPEPSPSALFALGMLAYAIVSRQRRQNSAVAHASGGA